MLKASERISVSRTAAGHEVVQLIEQGVGRFGRHH
jgi:hypothetical protein